MAYIGAVAPGYDPTRASVPQLDAERFSGNASTTAFTLVRQVVSPTDIDVYVENVKQEPTVAYSVSGYTLNFTEAPPTGTNNVYVIYRASATSNYAYVPDGSITYAKLANNIRQFTVDTFTANGTGTTVALTETPASANSLIVSVDGVIQTAPTNYTLSGNTITFTGTPDSGANVVVKHIGFRTTSTVTALQAGSVTATEIADSAVTTAKIAASAVTNAKLATGAVGQNNLANGNFSVAGTYLGVQSNGTTSYKILGQIAGVANTLTTIYTVPSSTSTYITCLSICNQTQNNMTIDVAVTPTGVTTGANNYILKSVTLLAADTLILEPGITLPTGSILAANTTSGYAQYNPGAANVSFHVYGVEIV